MNHFTAIGVPVYAMEDASNLFRFLLESATPLKSTIPDHFYCVWEAGQGSEVWFHCDEAANAITQTTPAFRGKTQLLIGITEAVGQEKETPLEGLLQGWVNPQGNDPDSGDYPMVFTWLDKGLHLPLEYPQIHTFQITAFAHELTGYPGEAAFSASQPSSGDPDEIKVSIGSESFIPTGMFVEEGDTPRPIAMFNGRVLDMKELTSPLDDESFYWLRVRTFGGEYDVVVSSDVIEGELAIDGIVSGSFWLCGRMASP
ncbi:MAG TPA: hypothetical protein PLE99_09875 [Candidatus Thiothrix moscowensis]|uniref:hypothetical protein n=1 Tax=Thiothrix sp. UBA2016 TaxID=1947695 RepID=UPI0025F3A157|nr:hypothetical protein [Thiothrix sp. UBA2016]HRJ53066.1 hypothetical protein [Candidatus Thiothrix moscowensis]HRJ93057.1 hypothetical protein [Candidatus Thiothrix moscowensis]